VSGPRYLVVDYLMVLKEMCVPNATGCITGPAGAAWPYRFIGCILSNMIRDFDVSLETFTPVTNIARKDVISHPFEVQTSRGVIATKHVIHCTNAYAATLLPALKGKLWPLRGQMTVQSVPESFPRLGNKRSWSTIWAQGFDYITQSAANDGSLYIGGGALQGGLFWDEDVGSTDDSKQSSSCLKHLEKVPKIGFGIADGTQVEKKWTGIMGFTGDGLPFVGQVGHDISGREDCDTAAGGEWIAAGWDGYGMVQCWLAGRALAKMIVSGTDNAPEWFPAAEFACTKARLDKMTPEGGLRRLLEI
jgi:glycine/D-amino acid oxidase-like deaminating enzyme